LFCPETTYVRDVRYDTDLAKDEKLQDLAAMETSHKEVVGEPGQGERADVPKKKTFVQELAVYTGVYSHDSILKFLFGPFLTLLNPAACYAVIASGLLNSWYVHVLGELYLRGQWLTKLQVRRIRHYPRWHLLRSSLELQRLADRLCWLWTFYRRYDWVHHHWLYGRLGHQVPHKAE
jgi:hypothetical protein